jgi:putative cell wall-binding protein
MRRWQAVWLVLVAVAGLVSAGPAAAAVGGIDWNDRGQVLTLPNGWEIRACEGDSNEIRCLWDGAEALGVIDIGWWHLSTYTSDGALEDDLRSDDPARLGQAFRRLADDSFAANVQDRREVCGDRYPLTARPHRDATLGGLPSVAWEFTGGLGAVRHEHIYGYYAVAEEHLFSLVFQGYTDSCVDELGAMSVATVETLAPWLDDIAAATTLPDLPGRPAVTIPAGPDGITYHHSRGEDEQSVGPNAMTIAEDGDVWIADTIGRRLLHYSPAGESVAIVAGIGGPPIDVATRGDEIVVLEVDPARGHQAVARLRTDGSLVQRHQIPDDHGLAQGLSGIDVDDRGAVVLELADHRLVQLVAPSGRTEVREVPGWRRHGMTYRFELGELGSNIGAIRAGDEVIEVSTRHFLTGMRFLGAGDPGSFFVAVEEVLFDEVIDADVVVREYADNGTLLGSVRFPLSEQYTHVEHPMAVGPDGVVYALLTRSDHAAVVPLRGGAPPRPILAEPLAERPAGLTNVTAAVALSRSAFSRSDVALLAREDHFADAVASGGAQGALGAPLLLTDGQRMSRASLYHLLDLQVTTVHVLGGEQAVSPAVEDTLRNYGFEVVRHAGADRVDTARLLAAAVQPTASRAVLARARGAGGDDTRAFVDSLAAGAAAAREGAPVLLVDRAGLRADVLDYLVAAGVRHVTIAGGHAAVPPSVDRELAARGLEVRRVAGENRFATAVGLAAPVTATSRVVLADGRGPDAWAPGMAAASQGGVFGASVVLSDGPRLPAETVAWLARAQGRHPTLLCAPYVPWSACDEAIDATGLRAGGKG